MSVSTRIADDIAAWVHRADDGDTTTAAGPLAGMRFGVKDIIDVRGMPTGYGLLDRAPRVATVDAWCVAALRAAGAIPLGKTHTTALASKDPAITRNPRIAGRTPGGSSAGSAAAVAAGHVPFALGTQTQGSVVRPSAFCGIVGFKPTYGLIPTQGVAPFAPSCDTVGILAADVATATRAFAAFTASASVALPARLRLAWAPATFADRFTPAVRAHLGAAIAALDPAAFAVETIALDEPVACIAHLDVLLPFEAHATLQPFRAAGTLPPGIDGAIARGATIGYDAYVAARRAIGTLRDAVSTRLHPYDALLLPIADEPPTPDSTGDPVPQAPWTAWGVPMAALPLGTLPSGAPVALGIVGRRGDDAAVLAIARRLEIHVARAGGHAC